MSLRDAVSSSSATDGNSNFAVFIHAGAVASRSVALIRHSAVSLSEIPRSLNAGSIVVSTGAATRSAGVLTPARSSNRANTDATVHFASPAGANISAITSSSSFPRATAIHSKSASAFTRAASITRFVSVVSSAASDSCVAIPALSSRCATMAPPTIVHNCSSGTSQHRATSISFNPSGMRRVSKHETHEKDEFVEAVEASPTSGALPLPLKGADTVTDPTGWSQHVQRPSNGPSPGTRRVFSQRSHIRSVEGDRSSGT
mmetsp:Transcript_2790/g.10704  ORF Transcript_2790/g.10704 Transcript_2790/m.10704 type:complete len:259 (+) Transcript_2790:441-1217(+)